MWECPKCKRTFIKENQNHFCLEKPKTIDEYILSFNEDIKKVLNEVRNRLRKELPEAKELISWSMPTYKDEVNIIHFAAFKNHLGIYPGAEAIIYFKDKLTNYQTSKGAIQFKYSEPIPLDLIAEIAKWCYETRNHH